MAELRWGSASDPGRLRDQNEDHHHAGDGLFVVADGMGGHLAGEVASEMAVGRLRDNLTAAEEPTLDQIVSAVDEANRQIYDDSLHKAEQAGMGTTISAIAVVADPHDGEVLAIINVGDSRGYVLRHGRLRQLTIDHSFVQELVAEGAISRDEARTHPRRNIVTRALGIEPSVRVDSWTMPIFRGDRFLLCSDGLVDEVADDDITAILREHADDPETAAQALVDAANTAGGRDNVTVVVVDVLEGDDPPDATEEFDIVPVWADADLEPTGETQIISDPLPEDGDGDAAPTAAAAAAGAAAPESQAIADVAEAPATDVPAEPKRKRSRGAGFFRFLLVLGVAAVLVLGFAIMAAWARSGYFVAFDDTGRVVIYQGREDGFLWFEPTAEAFGAYRRDELTDNSVDLVNDQFHFESQASAERFVAERLLPIEEDDTVDDSVDDDTVDDPASTTSEQPGEPG